MRLFLLLIRQRLSGTLSRNLSNSSSEYDFGISMWFCSCIGIEANCVGDCNDVRCQENHQFVFLALGNRMLEQISQQRNVAQKRNLG